MQKTIEVASQANLWNGGAPLGEALATGVNEARAHRDQLADEEEQLHHDIEMATVRDVGIEYGRFHDRQETRRNYDKAA